MNLVNLNEKELLEVEGGLFPFIPGVPPGSPGPYNPYPDDNQF